MDEKKADNNKRNIVNVGGQAVIEGVLMRGPKAWGMAVRKPDGEISLKRWPLNISDRMRSLQKVIFVRGCAVMWEMLKFGFKALNLSANEALGEDEQITKKEMFLTSIIAIGVVFLFFVFLPTWLAEMAGSRWNLSTWTTHIIEGILRGGFFILYVAGIGLWKDISRIYAYHGAEHKVINAYEAGAEMTPDRVKPYSRIHRRCGTSFLLVAVVVSIVVFGIVRGDTLTMRVILKFALIPVIVGIAYELIKLGEKYPLLMSPLVEPSLLLQYVTTREPDEKQLEVAIAALQEAMEEEKDVSAQQA